MSDQQKTILLIIGGGIAAYKCLELVRRLRDDGHRVRAVLTEAATEFVTPLSVGALTNEKVFTSLWNLDDEREIGHIRLARDADLVIVAPATADLLARMAGGHADDMATAVLLATGAPVLIAPAMNPFMWRHPATVRNVSQLVADGHRLIGPNVGEMAEAGEAGPGRMSEAEEIRAAANALLQETDPDTDGGPLAGRHVLVTTGPTHEPIDPVRYLANRSSGKQGVAIAVAAARSGARVTLVSGPTALAVPPGISLRRVETAVEMLDEVEAALPADIAVFTAAVADWRVAETADDKMKKGTDGPPTLQLVENPDILKTIARRKSGRPELVIGFAAETTNVVEHATRKRKTKGCDWIVANDVSAESGVMGGDQNRVHLITADQTEPWPEMSKAEVATRLMQRAAGELGGG